MCSGTVQSVGHPHFGRVAHNNCSYMHEPEENRLEALKCFGSGLSLSGRRAVARPVKTADWLKCKHICSIRHAWDWKNTAETLPVEMLLHLSWVLRHVHVTELKMNIDTNHVFSLNPMGQRLDRQWGPAKQIKGEARIMPAHSRKDAVFAL